MTSKPTIDWDFIRSLEGFELHGYVPKDRDLNDKTPSGVTIVGGFDIGQHSPQEIDKLDIPNSLCQKVRPYAGIIGDRARLLIKEKPLTLTQQEGVQLDNAVKSLKATEVVKEYNDNSSIDFLSLKEPIQTVIMSVAFQYGSLKRKTPNFFKSITQGDWPRAYNQLRDFGDSYQTRRWKEAEYLKQVL